jgi:hypothetical protein
MTAASNISTKGSQQRHAGVSKSAGAAGRSPAGGGREISMVMGCWGG